MPPDRAQPDRDDVPVYDRRERDAAARPWLPYVLTGLLVLAVLGLAYRLIPTGDRPSATGVATGFFADHVEMRLIVAKRPASVVSCVVRARERDGAEVARREITVGPQPAGQHRSTLDLRIDTPRPAVTAELLGCRPAGPR